MLVKGSGVTQCRPTLYRTAERRRRSVRGRLPDRVTRREAVAAAGRWNASGGRVASFGFFRCSSTPLFLLSLLQPLGNHEIGGRAAVGFGDECERLDERDPDVFLGDQGGERLGSRRVEPGEVRQGAGPATAPAAAGSSAASARGNASTRPPPGMPARPASGGIPRPRRGSPGRRSGQSHSWVLDRRST